MDAVLAASRRVLGIGVAWTTLWLGFWVIFFGIVGFLDPDSIDPGEGALALAAIFGPMGLLTGVVFGVLLSRRTSGGAIGDASWVLAIGWGMLATAVVQVLYLGHGDAGLVANTLMALLFTVFGGVVTAAWLAIARTWSRRSLPAGLTPQGLRR